MRPCSFDMKLQILAFQFFNQIQSCVYHTREYSRPLISLFPLLQSICVSFSHGQKFKHQIFATSFHAFGEWLKLIKSEKIFCKLCYHEGTRSKLYKRLKSSTITFATTPSQITTLHCFFAPAAKVVELKRSN